MTTPDRTGATDNGAIDGDALDWALRMADPGADWAAFADWLEADEARAARYDRAVIALEAATEAVRAHAMAPDPVAVVPAVGAVTGAAAHPPRPRARPAASRPRWIGAAAAAAMVAAIGLGVWAERDAGRTISTAAGEQRTIDLADGSSIALAGGSRIRLADARGRAATLEAGQALFRIRHDAARPFAVHAGALDLTDVGTVFDVRLLGARAHVAVAEGAVVVDPAGAKLRVDPGQSVTADDGRLRRGTQDPADVGTWRDGRLAYDGATLRDVAEDLSRQMGVRITAAPAVAGRTFNGTLETRSLRDDPAALGVLLDVAVRRGDGGWTLDARR